ncbi:MULTISPECIES: hypothetical protein [unclassified Luteococcus]|uniref:hypothetical protein n=1 Tax=unclassified Luteococcus TaxID=2639923 RepID=UPI00313E61AD
MDATETVSPTGVEAALTRREYLRRRYLSLGTGELVAAVTFAGVFGLYTSTSSSLRPAAPILWLSILPLEFILTQGGIYWLAARDWVKRSCMPPLLAGSFAVLTWANPLLLLAAVGMLAWQRPAGSAAALAVACVVFGAIEYVNYFWIRLSYPWKSWARQVTQWRRSRLRQDLETARISR